MPNTTIYADGIANITIIEGVARFDLINFAPTSAEPKAIKVVGSVGMSVQGLLRTHGQLHDLVNKLIEQGVLKKTEPGAAPQALGGSSGAAAPDYSVR
jgi:hypothetical protein